MNSPRLLFVTLTLVFLGCAGCEKESPVASESLLGRWVSQRNDGFVEFTPHGLCAEVHTTPQEVIVRKYTLEGNVAQLTKLTSSEGFLNTTTKSPVAQIEHWSLSLDADKQTLSITTDSGRARYGRIPPGEGSPEMVGLWSRARPDGKRDLVEFTSWGDVVSVCWLPMAGSKIQRPPFPSGEWHTYKRYKNFLRGEGISALRLQMRYLLQLQEVKPNSLTLTDARPKNSKIRGAKPETLERLDKLN